MSEKIRLTEIAESIVQGEYQAVRALINSAIEKGLKVEDILHDHMIPAMVEVGDRFEKKEIFIPEMMLSAKAMSIGFEILEPLFSKSEVKHLGTALIGTVEGDFHEIGKNIVAAMMKGNGINVIDLGMDVSAEKFVGAVKTHEVHILGMSALLTTTMSQMGRTIELLTLEGLRDGVKVMVGGGPVTDDFARQIGADYYGQNAATAARTARAILTDV